jgi:hypothetical protein
MLAVVLVATGAVGACGGRSEAPAPSTASPDAGAGAVGGAAASPTAPPYGPEVASLRLRRSTTVRFRPAADAKALGVVEEGTRVGWLGAASGPGCARWIEIAPRGWVCDALLEPSSKAPAGEERPHLADGALVPGVYGKVAGGGAVTVEKKKVQGALTVKKVGEVTHGGRLYWRTAAGALIPASSIALDQPSGFAGVTLGTDTQLPLAWAQAARTLGAPVALRARAEAKAAVAGRLAPRTVVAPEAEENGFVRVGGAPERWVAASDLHIARPSEPPDDLEGDGKWIDVDLDQQVLVAYRGRRPLYATLVSTGNPKFPTKSGVYRVWLKLDEADMSGQMGDEEAYSVGSVPWTMFFAKDLAFHTAYWHDRFGEARSHGCVNLAPRDARWLWEWAEPDMPPGWSAAHGVFERPGTLIKIHSAADPTPAYRGYARVVHEARVARRAAVGTEPEAADAGIRD